MAYPMHHSDWQKFSPMALDRHAVADDQSVLSELFASPDDPALWLCAIAAVAVATSNIFLTQWRRGRGLRQLPYSPGLGCRSHHEYQEPAAFSKSSAPVRGHGPSRNLGVAASMLQRTTSHCLKLRLELLFCAPDYVCQSQ